MSAEIEKEHGASVSERATAGRLWEALDSRPLRDVRSVLVALSKYTGQGLLAVLLLALSLSRSFAQHPLGTDVSGYQPANVDWASATNGGVRFAWSKATESTAYVNPNFASQMAGAVAAKVYIGAYHYARPSSHTNITGSSSADSEAAHFWNIAGSYIKYGGSYCVPMLDWEDPLMTNQLTASTLSAWVNEWCNAVSNYAYAAGVPALRPVVYTGTWYSRPSATYSGLTTAVTNWLAWISSYPSCDANNHCGTANPQVGGPSSSYPWSTWDIWQYGNTNWTGGDSDVYSSTLANFIRTFVIGGTNAPVFTVAPTNIIVTPGSSITFYSTVTGLTPMSMQWLFNGSLIAGASSSNLSLANIQVSQAGAYALVLSNSYASVTNIAYLTVLTNTPNAITAPAGLVDWWPAEGTPVDIVGGKSGTPQGGISYVAGSPGRAFHFDGSTSYVTTGAANVAVPWTACFWVNRQNAPSTAAALSGDGDYELKLEQYNGTRQVGFTIFGVNDYNFGYSVPVNTWTHLAFVATGTGASAQMQLYANGSLVGTITTNITCPRGYFGAGYINANHTSSPRVLDYMLGNLDEIMIFNRALSFTEINNLYAAGASGVVRAPEITGIHRVSPTQVQVGVRGLTGRNITLRTSQDFLAWTVLSSVGNPSGTVQFVDAFATNDFKLYRATQP